MHLLYRSTSFCIPAEKKLRDIDGRPERPSSVTRVRPDLNLSTHS